jgi:hypothetical protein
MSDFKTFQKHGRFRKQRKTFSLFTFYFLQVSVKSQAIWCALYKQSPGKDGWEVLGNIFFSNFRISIVVDVIIVAVVIVVFVVVVADPSEC